MKDWETAQWVTCLLYKNEDPWCKCVPLQSQYSYGQTEGKDRRPSPQHTASLTYPAANNKNEKTTHTHLRQSGRWGPTPEVVLQPAYTPRGIHTHTLTDMEAHHTHHTKYSFLKGVNWRHKLAHEGTETLDWTKGWTQEGSQVWETPRTDEITERVNKWPHQEPRDDAKQVWEFLLQSVSQSHHKEGVTTLQMP